MLAVAHFAGRSGGGQERGGRRRSEQERAAAEVGEEDSGLIYLGKRWRKKEKKRKIEIEKFTQKKPYLKSATSPWQWSPMSKIVLSRLKTRISAHCNELAQNRRFFTISPNSGDFTYLPHKYDGFFGINSSKISSFGLQRQHIHCGELFTSESNWNVDLLRILSSKHLSAYISSRFTGKKNRRHRSSLY
jgi:hypothetical protein